MSDQLLHLSIDHWLEKLDLTVYRSILKDYTGVEEILWMTERDLKNIGIKNGSHRARLGTSIAILKNKYEKSSKENRNLLNQSFNTLQVEKARSNASISPIRKVHLDESQSGVRSWPSTKPSTSHTTKHSSPRSSIESFVGTEATAEELKQALEKELSLDSSDLRSYAWYHGTILRQRAEELVTQDEDFIVRDCISQPGDFVITCKWKNMPLHFIIKKIILQPDTVYERIQYCFEKESFDSISDFVTYYVGSRCPLSEASGVIISRPVNRVMPLSYYASRYGIQCQIHYVAKALEKIPSDSEMDHKVPCQVKSTGSSPIGHFRSKQLNQSFEHDVQTEVVNSSAVNNETKHPSHLGSKLIRMGSDPMLSPNTERKILERRPNSGLFSSDAMQPVFLKTEDKPPPKPSRVPSKKYPQKPYIRKDRKLSEHEDVDIISMNCIPIPGSSLAHATFQRQSSETRFSFLDRPSVSSGSSTPDADSLMQHFTLPNPCEESAFVPQKFGTRLLSSENPPLEAAVLSKIRQILFAYSPRTLACHLTRMDLEVAKQYEDIDLGLGVTSGLELLLLPQGEQMQEDLIERTKSIKLFVAVTILTTPEEGERMKMLNTWIEIAIETKTVLGNFYGFTSIMLGLTLPEILELHSTWLALRHSHTETAFVFETKLRPTFKALHNASGHEAPNTCLPYILSLILILQQYISVMNKVGKESLDSEAITDDILNFSLPGYISTNDFGLQLLADHLDTGRNIMQQIPILRKNRDMSVQCVMFDEMVMDVFRTEFHLRLLWGFRGSVVCAEQRHQIFQKVIYSLHRKCNLNH